VDRISRKRLTKIARDVIPLYPALPEEAFKKMDRVVVLSISANGKLENTGLRPTICGRRRGMKLKSHLFFPIKAIMY